MGTLYMRVNGQWEAVTPYVPDEVQIGPSAPTGGGADLWVDSDDVGGPSINALIDGAWQKITQPVPDEVWVGPDAPASSGTELWYDTDAPGYTYDDLRWLSAWGVIGRAVKTTNQGGFSSGTAPGEEISGLGTSVNSVVGRRYRISCDVAAYADQHNIQVNFVLRLNRTYTMQACNFPLPVANYGNRNYLELHYAPAQSGVETWTMNIFRTYGAGNFAVNATTEQPLQLVIEDVGPATGTAVPSQIVTPWTTLPFAANWQSYPGFQPCQYRKVGDIVYLRGLAQMVNASAGVGIAILPAGFRPPARLVIPRWGGEPNAGSRVDILNDGSVQIAHSTPAAAANNWIALDGIAFSVTA